MIGLLSDVHGNVAALRRCLDYLEGRVSALYSLGDAVGYYPQGCEIVKMLGKAGAVCLQGNHEAMLLGDLPISEERDRLYGLARLKDGIDAATMDTMKNWPKEMEVSLGGRRVYLAHGSPLAPLTGYTYMDSDHGFALDSGHDAIFLGHTHRPFVRLVGSTLLVNVGSVGLPRDEGLMASVAIYDPASNRAEIHRIPFDRDEVIRCCQGLALPREVLGCMARKGTLASKAEGEWVA